MNSRAHVFLLDISIFRPFVYSFVLDWTDAFEAYLARSTVSVMEHSTVIGKMQSKITKQLFAFGNFTNAWRLIQWRRTMTTQTKTLDKSTLQIIFYLIERLNGVLGKTHLQKMLFLSDLLAVKKFKEKLTAIDYKKYHYGPYAEAINDYTADLKRRSLIEEREYPFMDGSDRSYSRYFKKAQGSVKAKLLENIGAEKVVLLDGVINSYGNMSLQDVLDVVYRLEVVKGAEKNKPLEMAKKVESANDEPEDDAVMI